MSRAARRRGSGLPGGAGFTILELVVAFAVLTLAVALAARLLSEGQRQLAASGRQALDAPIEATVERLRRDAMAASSMVGGGVGLWSHQALELRVDGQIVRWRLDAGDLIRERFDAGAPPEETLVLPSVLTFRWRTPSAGWHPLLDVELVDRAAPRVIGIAARGAGAPVLRRRAVRVVLRGATAGAW